MQQYFALSPLIWLGLTCFTNVLSSCPPITVGDLGSTTDFSTDGLLPAAVRPPGEVVERIPVRIINYYIVCDASGMSRDTSSFASVLVQFQCNFPSGTNTLADCDGTTMLTRQYQFSCSGNAWDDSIAGDDLFVQTLNPSATFVTPLDNQCRRCIDDQQRPTTPIDSSLASQTTPSTAFSSFRINTRREGLGDCLYHFGSVRQDLGAPIRLQNVNDVKRLKFSIARTTLFVELSSPR